jgi:hypothetical protein
LVSREVTADAVDVAAAAGVHGVSVNACAATEVRPDAG